MKKTANS